jgi:hypothetical protein
MELTQHATIALNHLIGKSNHSLGLVPALYFYTLSGRHVRSLLYGLIYWLLAGTNENDVLARKRVFCVHRQAFERILLTRKEDIVSGITRKTGSGPEITFPTAKYYQSVLELLIKHEDQLESEGFSADYNAIVDGLVDKRGRQRDINAAVESRIFTERQKSTATLQAYFANPILCEICGGMIDLATGDVQHDHIHEWSRGGETASSNIRLVHPFCNLNRQIIEDSKQRLGHIQLPTFDDPERLPSAFQLNFLSFVDGTD